jgi:hypothetical protein
LVLALLSRLVEQVEVGQLGLSLQSVEAEGDVARMREVHYCAHHHHPRRFLQ